jgi:hypothetical protein
MREELKHNHKRCHEMKQIKYIVNYRNKTKRKKRNINGHLYTAKKNEAMNFSLGKAV